MKTEVIMQRDFMGGVVSQKSQSGMFSATDLIKIANIKRRELGKGDFNLTQFLKSESTLDFIEELQKENLNVVTVTKGRNGGTWVHPLLFIDIALAINPKFKVEVYKWLYDELLKYRNQSGDSYKKMCGSIYDRHSNKSEFHRYITKVCNHIKECCGVKDWNSADEKQLRLRDKMHDNISLLCSVLNDVNQAVRLGVKKALEDNV